MQLRQHLSECQEALKRGEDAQQQQTRQYQELQEREAALRADGSVLEAKLARFVQANADILTVANERNAALTHELVELGEEYYSFKQHVQAFLGRLQQGATALMGNIGLKFQ